MEGLKNKSPSPVFVGAAKADVERTARRTRGEKENFIVTKALTERVSKSESLNSQGTLLALIYRSLAESTENRTIQTEWWRLQGRFMSGREPSS